VRDRKVDLPVAYTPVRLCGYGKREKERLKIIRTLVVEPPDGHIARLAGTAIGLVGAGVVDALIMASASLRGDTVYSSDMAGLARLRDVFPGVELEHV
jgi:hypothetical protein